MRRPVVIGVVAVAVLIMVGAGIAFAIGSSDEASGKAGATTTTTTTKPRSRSGTSSTTKTGAGTEPSTVDPSVPPDPLDAYQPLPLPVGISATVSSCKWSPSNGGELEAAGTITNRAGEDDVWLITAVWLQRNQTQNEDIDDQSDVIDLSVGQSKPWKLSISASSAPPDLSCALEIE